MAAAFSPQVRAAFLGLGFVALCVLGLVAATFVALVAYHHLNRSPEPEPIESDNDWESQPLSAVVPKQPPQSTAALLTQLRTIDWFQFEKLVAFAYRKSGYTVISRGGANPDGGIDLILEKDGQRTAVQCKQWKTWNVGVKAVREFLGALKDSEIEKGIFITLQGYTGAAKLLADKHRIEILNETGLAKLLEATHAQHDSAALAILHDEQKYCPKCESEMVLRTAGKGRNAGQEFWGCSRYPKCHYILRT